MTQVDLAVNPPTYKIGYFGTYEVPSNLTSMFWREGTFSITAPVLWTEIHTHPKWVKVSSDTCGLD